MSRAATASAPPKLSDTPLTNPDNLGSTTGSLPSTAPPSTGADTFRLVVHKLVSAGARVHKGDVVAEFDRQFMLNRLDDYRASTRQAEASFRKIMSTLDVTLKAHEQQVAAAKAALDKARLDMQTVAVRSAIDAEKLKLALEEADAQYKQLKSEEAQVEISERAQTRIDELDLQQSQIELKRSEDNVNRLLLRAGMDGIVVMQTTFRGADFGQYQVGDMMGAGVLFMTIVDPRSIVVNATVNQVDAERVHIGSKAKVRFDAYPDLVLPAHVSAIGAMPGTGGLRPGYMREIPVRLQLDGHDPRVIPDLSVSTDVILEQSESAPVVSRAAVLGRQPDQTAFVYVQHGQGWQRRPIRLGLVNNLQAVVREGLQPGEVVALEQP